ncbi:SDR family NAD(P)-dependent oxidoreductase [Bradyrhizobium sp. CSA207]|uniref:SDR family NAD(P)-dependent oxidoreductase n=1 Tax=Bradyrhizobium sp. CSA207 TaxID=2698826 RepID=UPI0023B1669D|nr:SDR family NAD(P)-dependent oxidoreductase [Bradyrhizobium sp. CSA207]MDE5445801.1 SDR family NAD(P)-dependent oxidoreductase [Bradyrhizobium sp. CSA207]
MNIDGRTVIVTGGASGLGAAAAEHLAAQGAHLVIADKAEERGRELAKKIDGIFIRTDVTSEDDAVACVKVATETFGAVHALVNCAGVADGERVLGKRGPASLTLFQRVIHINLIGTFNMLRVAANAMRTNEPDEDGERGVIIGTASVAAFDGQIGQAAYSASKAGIAGMTLPIARDLAKSGIRMVTIAPGLFETPMMSGVPEKVQDGLRQMMIFPQRFGRPREYGLLVGDIISNVMINGETIRLDGGVRLSAK